MRGAWGPFELGLGIVIVYLLLRCTFDGLFLLTWGFPEGLQPLWRSDVWWPELVNAILLGYIPAVLVIARSGVDRDLAQLRPGLPGGDIEKADIIAAATGPTGLVARVFIACGIAAGFIIVFVDPSFSESSGQSLSNPAFLWPLMRTPLFAGLICALIIADVKATRCYFNLGRNLIKVDLLEQESLSAFARRGLRSALTWVVFSMIFSLFWVGDNTASSQNLPLFIFFIAMAIGAFAIPLMGVHSNIVSVKRTELDRLRDEIRIQRSAVLGEPSDRDHTGPQLANLIGYYQLIDRTREWPIDAANLLRFLMYLLIGLGSWLGGAVVERLLDSTLSG